MSGLMVGNAVVIQYVAGEGAVTTAAYVAIAVWLLMRARHLQPNAVINTATTIDKPQPVSAVGR